MSLISLCFFCFLFLNILFNIGLGIKPQPWIISRQQHTICRHSSCKDTEKNRESYIFP